MELVSCDVMTLAKGLLCVPTAQFCLTPAFSLPLCLAKHFIEPGFLQEPALFNDEPPLETKVYRWLNC